MFRELTQHLTRRIAVIGAILATSVLVTTGASASAPQDDPLPPVPSLDIPRYLGTWYQLAAVPQLFSAQCAKDTTAEYAAIDADTISVRNSCRTWWGTTSTIEGTADVVDPVTNAQLRVRFPFVPDGGGNEPNYVVTYIDADYTVAIVGDPLRDSGFVLARGVSLSKEQWRGVKRIIRDRGYDVCDFLISPVDGGKRVPLPLCLAR